MASVGSRLGLWQKNYGKMEKLWTMFVCVHFYVCMCEKERHGYVQTHTLPKSHRGSQGAQSISDPNLVQPRLPPPPALSFLFLPDAKGRKRVHAIPHLPLRCHDIPALSVAGGQGQRGAQSRVRQTDSGNSTACYRNERTALSAWSAEWKCLEELFYY